MKKQYLIYSDESYIKGQYFSNFYGGALVEYNKLKKEVFENGTITLSKKIPKSRPIAVNLKSQNEAITINTLTVSDDE